MSDESAVVVPDWLTVPKDDWRTITPEEAGLDPKGFAEFIGGLDVKGANFGGEDHSGNQYGAVLTRIARAYDARFAHRG